MVLLVLKSHQALKVQVLRYGLSMRLEYLKGLSGRHTLLWLSANTALQLLRPLYHRRG